VDEARHFRPALNQIKEAFTSLFKPTGRVAVWHALTGEEVTIFNTLCMVQHTFSQRKKKGSAPKVDVVVGPQFPGFRLSLQKNEQDTVMRLCNRCNTCFSRRHNKMECTKHPKGFTKVVKTVGDNLKYVVASCCGAKLSAVERFVDEKGQSFWQTRSLPYKGCTPAHHPPRAPVTLPLAFEP